MRITIQTPLKNNEIKELLDGSELDGIKLLLSEKKESVWNLKQKA